MRSVPAGGIARRGLRRAALVCSLLTPVFMAGQVRAQLALALEPGVPGLPATSGTVLPRTGVDSGVSDLREHLLSAYGDAQPASSAKQPDLQITGQFGISEQYTDNAGAAASGARNRGYDVITEFLPGITVVDTSQRLQVNLNYQPIGQLYARNSDFSQLQEQANGDILLTALPGWLYIDARGNISQQSVYGGLGPASTVTLSPNNRQTTSSLSFSPYITRSLGGAGTLQAGAGYIYSATDAPPLAAGETPLLFAQQGTYGSSYLATKRAFASYATGENAGRLQNRVGTDDDLYAGAGALAGGRRILVTDDISYAATRLVTMLGEAGYEDVAYPRSGFSYSGPVGAAGVRLTPNRGSALTVEYRYTDGFGSAYVQGSVQVSPRIRVFGDYSAGVSTFQQDAQNALLDGTADVTGAAASVLQAAPLLEGTSAFGANQNLSREHRLDATATYLGVFDTVSVSFNRQTTTPIGRQVGSMAAVSTSGTFGSINERHELTPNMSLSGFLQIGSNQNGLTGFGPGRGQGTTLSVSAGLDRTFTETLTGFFRVGGTYVIGGSAVAATGIAGYDSYDTTVTIGAIKKF